MAGHCSKQDAQYDSEERGGKRFKRSFSSNDLSSNKSIKDQANVTTMVNAETGATINLQRSILHFNVTQQTSAGNKPENVQDIEEICKEAISKLSKVNSNREGKMEYSLEVSREICTRMRAHIDYFTEEHVSSETDYETRKSSLRFLDLSKWSPFFSLTFQDPSKSSLKPILYDQLIREYIMGTTPNCVALVGPAGSGKTTLLKKIYRDLSSSRDKLIVFLNFRDLYTRGDKEINSVELLFGNLPLNKTLRDLSYEWLRENHEKIIFLLDGLDQVRYLLDSEAKCVTEHCEGSASDIVSNILRRDLFPNSKIVFSSREHSVSSLEGKLRPREVISLIGFSFDDAEYLFTNSIQKNGQNFWNKMEPSLKALLTTPAFLTFSVHVYKRNSDSPPTSLTDVMQKLFNRFIRSDNVKNKKVGQILKKLWKLSYIGLSNKKVSFHKLDFDEADLDLDEVTDFVIIVPDVNFPTVRLIEGDYFITFSHQSIQEFFAAEYIVRMDIDSFKKVVDEDLREDYWSVVTRFVSGLLLNRTSKFEDLEISDLAEKQDILKTMLSSEYAGRELIIPAKASTLSILASIAETEDSNFIRSTIKKISFCGLFIGISGMSPIASIVRRCENLKEIDLHNCGLDVDTDTAQFLWENIKHHDVKVDKMNVSFNEELGGGFQYICKLAARCKVRRLSACGCQLQSSQLSWVKEMKPSQLNELNLSGNGACDACLEDIGTIINDGGELRVSVTGKNGLQPLERAMKTKKLQDLIIDFTNEASTTDKKRPKVPDTCFATAANIIANHGLLSLCYVDANYSGLNSLKLALDKKEILLLGLPGCDIHADGMAVVGQIAERSSVEKLHMTYCKLDVSGIDRMLTEFNHTMISELDLSESRIESTSVVTNQIKQCSIKNLDMRSCKLDASALRGLFSALNGVKVSKLDLSSNDFDGDCSETIGKIVTQCSVDELNLSVCGITDDALDRFLTTAREVKLTRLDVTYNRLSSSAIEKIRESITVEELKDVPQSPW